MSKSKSKSARILKLISRSVLLIFSILIFVFALVSGAEQMASGIKGILLNSPNALPWLVLLIFNYLAWKWPKIGGLLIMTMALITIYAFGFYERENIFGLFIIPLPLFIFGSLFVLSDYLEHR